MTAMKTILSLGLALAALAPAGAQIFRPAVANGALFGGIAGAIIGNNSGSLHHNAWQGAAIGATAGLLFGSGVDAGRYDAGWQGSYVYRGAPRGYGYYGYLRSSGYGYGRGFYGRPNYVGSRIFWGGVTGAIIGNNSRGFHHDAWRGAAWGAGLGYIFGSIAESNARYREVVERPPVYVQPVPAAPPAQPQTVTIINNYYNTPATPMDSANGLFGRN